MRLRSCLAWNGPDSAAAPGELASGTVNPGLTPGVRASYPAEGIHCEIRASSAAYFYSKCSSALEALIFVE